MKLKLAVVMDPIQHVNIKKDSTFKMINEAWQRDYALTYIEAGQLFSRDGESFCSGQSLTKGNGGSQPWYVLGEEAVLPLTEFDVVLMRQDPPFDMEYVYSTYLLELAEQKGVLVVNKPQSLRDANEKFFAQHFPECCAPCLVSKNPKQLKSFLLEQQDIIIKPLDGMGGASIFRLRPEDPNVSVVLETITQFGKETVMAQKFIPEISQGDKRILVVDGEPVPYALARIPAQGETRGNLAAGGHGVAQPISERDAWICQQVKPILMEKGLIFVGLDIIGDYLTEINVTSPTCIQEIEQAYPVNIAGQLFDAIERKLQ